MTSGVRQALPQVLAPRAEARAGVRDRTGSAGFADTLDTGRPAGQGRTGVPKPHHSAIDARTPWPALQADAGPDEAARPSQHIAQEGDDPKPARADDAAAPSALDSDANPIAASFAARLPLAGQAAPAGSGDSLHAALAATTAAGAGPSEAHPARSVLPAGKPSTEPEAWNALPHAPDEAGHARPPTANLKPGADAGFSPFAPVRVQRTDVARFEPLPPPGGLAGSPDGESSRKPSDAPVAADKAAPRLTVVAQQTVPAPAPTTAIALADSIAAGGLLDTAAPRFSLGAVHASAAHAPAQSLKVQLHPAELGMVTATLRFAGGQLSIELRVDSQEAYQRLSGDSDALVGALRDLGYEVDRVAVVQSSAAPGAGRAEPATPLAAAPGRGSDQSGAGLPGGGSGGSEHRSAREGGNQGFREQQHHKNHGSEEVAGNIYI